MDKLNLFFLNCVATFALLAASVQGQTLLTETTWGGAGSDVAEGVASAADGSSYVVGITDSFTTDQFGNPSPENLRREIRGGWVTCLAKNLERDHRQRSWANRRRARRR